MKDALTKEIESRISYLISDSKNAAIVADEIAKWHIQKQIDLLNEIRQYDNVDKLWIKLSALKSQLK